MHIKIYFDDKPVYLCDEIDKELNEILHHPDAVFIDEISNAALKSLLHEIVKPEFHAGVVWNNDLERLKKAFFKNFTLIEAAGGIVQNEKKELLFIYRLEKWDLPKGKLDKGETIEECAIREVEEETGIGNVELGKLIGLTFHEYFDRWINDDAIKETHWYEMKVKGNPTPTPQEEEHIEKIIWANEAAVNECLKNSYPNIEDIIAKYKSNES